MPGTIGNSGRGKKGYGMVRLGVQVGTNLTAVQAKASKDPQRPMRADSTAEMVVLAFEQCLGAFP